MKFIMQDQQTERCLDRCAREMGLRDHTRVPIGQWQRQPHARADEDADVSSLFTWKRRTIEEQARREECAERKKGEKRRGQGGTRNDGRKERKTGKREGQLEEKAEDKYEEKESK